jgi:methyl-accepting chemotaxis protein
MSNSSPAQDSLNQRLEFNGLDSQTRATLIKLQPLLKRTPGSALDALYERIRATPETRKFFGDERRITSAKGAQERHWEIIAAAAYNEE